MSEELNKSNNDYLRKLSVLRQAFVFASIIIITGVILSVKVDINFIALPVIVSFGLMFAGIVGWCPMIFMLEHMPWNKK